MITHKKLWIFGGVLVALAAVFTALFLLCPEKLGIEPAVTELEYETKLFDKNQVMTVDIAVDEEEWNQSLENATAEEYISCDLTINGETIYNVGIRPKGNTSLTFVANDPDSDRFSFKVEFDHYVTGQSCYGLDKLALNNIYADATYMKEYLAYDIMNYLGVETPLYSFANITLNGQPWGLYLAVETLEESYAQRNFGSNYGQLYKPETTGMGGGGMGRQGKAVEQVQETNPSGVAGQALTADTPSQASGPPTEGAPEFAADGRPTQQPGEKPDGTGGSGQGPDTTGSPGEEAPDLAADGRPTEQPDSKPSMKPEMGGGGGSGNKNGADLVYVDDNPDSYSSIFDNAVFDTTAADEQRVITALQKLNAGEGIEQYVDVDAMLRYWASNTFLVNLDSYQSSMAHNYYLYEQNGQIKMLPWDYNLAFGGFQAGSASAAINFPIDTPVSGVELSERPMLAKLLEVDSYQATYHQYLADLMEGYFDSGHFSETIQNLDALIGEYVKNDATAFYTYDEYQAAVETLEQFGLKRAESVKGQLAGEIPSTEEGQKAQPQKLVSAGSININTMGSQGGGEGGGRGGFGQNNQNRETANNTAGQPPNQQQAVDGTQENSVAGGGNGDPTAETTIAGQANESNASSQTANTENPSTGQPSEAATGGSAQGNRGGPPGQAGGQGNQPPQLPGEKAGSPSQNSLTDWLLLGGCAAALALAVVLVAIFKKKR